MDKTQGLIATRANSHGDDCKGVRDVMARRGTPPN